MWLSTPACFALRQITIINQTMNQPLELRKSRDFGQIISDSFVFLRQNFKPLFRYLLVICGFFILVGTVTSTMQYMHTGQIFTNSVALRNESYDVSSDLYTYYLSVLFNALIL